MLCAVLYILQSDPCVVDQFMKMLIVSATITVKKQLCDIAHAALSITPRRCDRFYQMVWAALIISLRNHSLYDFFLRYHGENLIWIKNGITFMNWFYLDIPYIVDAIEKSKVHNFYYTPIQIWSRKTLVLCLYVLIELNRMHVANMARNLNFPPKPNYA